MTAARPSPPDSASPAPAAGIGRRGLLGAVLAVPLPSAWPARHREIRLSRYASPEANDPSMLQVSVIAALTGGLSLAGDAFRNGVEMAVQEINGAGGLAGRLIRTATYDTQSSPQGARATAPRAMEGGPLALLGPVAPAETLALAPFARAHRVLQIAAAAPPGPHDGLLLLAAPGLAARMARLAAWLAAPGAATPSAATPGAATPDAAPPVRRVALLSVGAGRGEASALLAGACRSRGIEVVASLALPPGPRPGPEAELARQLPALLAHAPDALFISASGRVAGQLVASLRRAAPDLLLFGGADLVDPAVLHSAGPAAVGLRALAALTPLAPAAPVEQFRTRFEALYHSPAEPEAMQGYIAVAMFRAAVTRCLAAAMPPAPAAPTPLPPGLCTGPALAAVLRAGPLTPAEAPGILLDTAWTATGEPQRTAWLAEVLPGGRLGWTPLAA